MELLEEDRGGGKGESVWEWRFFCGGEGEGEKINREKQIGEE